MAFDIDPYQVAEDLVVDMDRWVRNYGKSYKEAFRDHLPTLPYGRDSEVRAIVGSIIGKRPRRNSRKDHRRARRLAGMNLTPSQEQILSALPGIREKEEIRRHLAGRDYRHTNLVED